VKRDDAEDIDASCAFPSTAGKYRTHHSWSWDQRLGSSAARNHACGHLAKEGSRFDRNLRVYSPATECVLIQHECGGLSIRSRSCLWCYRVVSRMETRISLAKKDKDRELSSYLSLFQRSEFLTRPRSARRASWVTGSKWSSAHEGFGYENVAPRGQRRECARRERLGKGDKSRTSCACTSGAG
jgi:hypothetical protein